MTRTPLGMLDSLPLSSSVRCFALGFLCCAGGRRRNMRPWGACRRERSPCRVQSSPWVTVFTLGHCFHWQQEAEVNLRKAKQIYMQRSEEHDKAKYMAVKAEEEQQNTTSSITTKTLDKKRRLEEEAKNKVGTWQLWTRAEHLPGKNLLTPCCPSTGAALS